MPLLQNAQRYRRLPFSTNQRNRRYTINILNILRPSQFRSRNARTHNGDLICWIVLLICSVLFVCYLVLLLCLASINSHVFTTRGDTGGCNILSINGVNGIKQQKTIEMLRGSNIGLRQIRGRSGNLIVLVVYSHLLSCSSCVIYLVYFVDSRPNPFSESAKTHSAGCRM